MRSIARWLVVLACLALPGAVAAAEEALEILTGDGAVVFRVELADTPAARAQGLMFREELDADAGMLFDFGDARQVTMWMRNTPLSLDMVFIDEAGVITRIAERTEPFSDTVIPSGGPVKAVLEINGGVAAELGISPGDRVLHRIFE